MLSIDSYPGYILMGRNQLISSDSYLILPLASLITNATGRNLGPIQTELISTSNAAVLDKFLRLSPVGIITLEADNKCVALLNS
jgi:hypothetical protein